MTTPTHAGLTADMFVVRGGTFLSLERGPGRGEGVWHLPGGLVERGEDPLVAAVRETREETGLEVHGVRVLRVWTYATPEGHDTVHATFDAAASSVPDTDDVSVLFTNSLRHSGPSRLRGWRSG